jgi:hypothetical protein
MKGAKLFARWLYAVHRDLAEETRLSNEPNNVKLPAYAGYRHSNCILPSLKQISQLPPGINANNSILRQLIKTMNRNSKVCKETTKIHQAEYKWKKDIDEIKKDRDTRPAPFNKNDDQERVHNQMQQGGELGENFLSLYNSKTHWGLDI